MLNILFYFCFSALVLIGVALWRGRSAQQRTNGSLINERECSGSPFGFVDVIVMFFFWLGGQVVSLAVAAYFLNISIKELPEAVGDTKSWATIFVAAGQLLATLLAVGIFLLRYRRLSVVGLRWKFLGPDLKIGLVSFLMVVPAILLLQWLLVQLLDYAHPTMEMLAKNANGLTLVAAWFSAVLVAPVIEEVFFRGVFQAWLQRLGEGAPDSVLVGGWDSRSKFRSTLQGTQIDSSGEFSWTTKSFWPIVISSMLFALAHVGQGPAPISLFVFGLVLGYIFRRTGSIIPCIVLHMMLNAFTMFWFTLRVFFEKPDATDAGEQVVVWAQVFYLF